MTQRFDLSGKVVVVTGGTGLLAWSPNRGEGAKRRRGGHIYTAVQPPSTKNCCPVEYADASDTR